ncbi:MAG TPA: hypothetical protein ACFYD7_11320 [Candidatus Wujingus californicus]|uniref:hypothetical protein n=1 Tax=Candidatus Wujingus californicus TaxID=3367618 RepID=UPI001D40A5C7|nr:hypothetical protein [Planctomycetota bacterium]
MKLIIVILYFLFVINLGSLFIRRKVKDSFLLFLGSFVVGATIVTTVMHLLSQFRLLTPVNVFLAISLMVIPLILRFNNFVEDIKCLKNAVFQFVSTGFKSKLLIVIIAIVLGIYLMDAWTPPRSGDAMRYHLAQLKDIYWNEGFIFRPYAHYNFPINFSYLVFPVYLVCGEVGVQLSVFVQLFFVFIILIKACHFYEIKNGLFVILLFLLTPLVLQESTIVANDLFVIVFLYTGFIFLAESKTNYVDINLFLGSLAVGYAWASKYYPMFFLFWFIYLLWKTSGRKIVSFLKRSSIFFLIVNLSALIYYLRNYLNTSNPIWPSMVKYFSSSNELLNDVAYRFILDVAGTRTIATYLNSFKEFFKYPECLFFIWFIGIWGLWTRKKDYFGEGIGSVLFLTLWGFLSPAMYIRLIIFILPPYIYLAVLELEDVFAKKYKLRFALATLVGFYLTYGIVITGWYSYDYLEYQITRNLKSHHKATFFYNEYDWINKNLLLNAKLAVMVSCQQTFYLDREYINIDPALSAYIDWEKIKTVDDFYDFLCVNNIDYLFVDIGAASASRFSSNIVNNIEKDSRFKTIWERTTELMDSRILRRSTPANVRLVQILKFQPEKDWN